MPEQSNLTNLPNRAAEDGSPLAVLLDTARELVSQEIDRGDRLDGKARNQFAAVGALFAVVMATVVALLNVLVANNHHPQAWVYPTVGVLALVAAWMLVHAFSVSLDAWRTREVDTIEHTTITNYLPFAEKGYVAIVKHLIDAYAGILEDRRRINAERAVALQKATGACVYTAAASVLLLMSVLVAIITQ